MCSSQHSFLFQEEDYLFLYSKMDNRNAVFVSLISKSGISAQTGDIRTLTIAITVIASILAGLLVQP